MTKYRLTLEQFKEFAAPFIREINEIFVDKEHKQLGFYVTIPCGQGIPNGDQYEIEYCVVGYHIDGKIPCGKITASIQNCFNLTLKQDNQELLDVDIEKLKEDMQEALWQYCYNLFGTTYKEDLFQFMLTERESLIYDLNKYIKGIENANISMNIVEKEVQAAQDEIRYTEQLYDHYLEVINALSFFANPLN